MSNTHTINLSVLKQCRIQIGLDDIDKAKEVTRVPTLDKMEDGEKQPSLIQQEKLSDAYAVPSWVFFKQQLPAEYDITGLIYPEFRSLSGKSEQLDYNLNKVITIFNRYRRNLLEINDGASPIKFDPPQYNADVVSLAKSVKDWLGYSSGRFQENKSPTAKLEYWKKLLEARGVLIFTTSTYRHWSKIDAKLMRGMAIYHDVLPVIVLNGSDAIKANLFTLMHELGHILRKDTALNKNDQSKETFCNKFAAEMLMPDKDVLHLLKDIQGNSDRIQKSINVISKVCGVSQWAAAVKLKVKREITLDEYEGLKKGFQQEIEDFKQNNKGFGVRNRPQEIVDFYSRPYTRAILQLYYDDEITVTKVLRTLGFKNFNYLEKIEGIV